MTQVPDLRPPPEPRAPYTPTWLRAASEWTWRSLVVGIGVVALIYALGYLRIIVLPIIIALLITALLMPPRRWLTGRGLSDGLATAVVVLGALLVLVGFGSVIFPALASQADEFGQGIQDGVRKATDVLSSEPFNVSEEEVDRAVDRAIERLRENSASITSGITSGAILVGELLTGLVVTLLLAFFFLKDGPFMWSWLTRLIGHERELDEVGGRIYGALSGYLRGIALVGLVDALLIGLALVLIGVPLVLPLMMLTFLGAFVPFIGAFLAGLAAVLIALVSNGFAAAALTFGAIVLIQQIEGNLLYPILMSRTVHLHPAVILIALAIGGIVAGLVGVFLAVPVAGAVSTVLAYVREREPGDQRPSTSGVITPGTPPPAGSGDASQRP